MFQNMFNSLALFGTLLLHLPGLRVFFDIELTIAFRALPPSVKA